MNNEEDIYTVQNMLNEIASSLTDSNKEETEELAEIISNNGFELSKLVASIKNGETDYLENVLEVLSVKYRDDTEDEAYIVLSSVLEVIEMVVDPTVREEILRQEDYSTVDEINNKKKKRI